MVGHLKPRKTKYEQKTNQTNSVDEENERAKKMHYLWQASSE